MNLEELSHDTFYRMENYSQIVIDLVSDAEDLYTYEENKYGFGALAYTVGNVIEVIDKTREHDLKALKDLYRILMDELEK
jgi:hypothetical protein